MKTTMIKAVFLLAILASGGAITLAAGNGMRTLELPEPTSANTSALEKPAPVYKWIQQNLICPDFIDSNNDVSNKVELWLHIEENGSITIKKVLGLNPTLVEYVRQTLHGKIYNLEESGKDFHFAIHFRRIG